MVSHICIVFFIMDMKKIFDVCVFMRKSQGAVSQSPLLMLAKELKKFRKRDIWEKLVWSISHTHVCMSLGSNLVNSGM